MKQYITYIFTIMLCYSNSVLSGPLEDFFDDKLGKGNLNPVKVRNTSSSLDRQWWKKGVIYQIHVRSFYDSDGDGYGDFKGVIEKLDYLQELGVSGVWLLPIMQSRFHTNGYDVVNHRGLEKDYGSFKSLQRLINELHARGMGVLFDYVINHSETDHALFIASKTIDSYRDWYIWSDHNPGWKQPFDISSGPTWHSFEGRYYYGIFSKDLPDFNLRNKSVVDYHLNSIRFWLNMGFDGIRLDAAHTLIENGRGKLEDQPESIKVLNKVKDVVENEYDNKFLICEGPSDYARYANACGHSFAFGLNYDLIKSVINGEASGRLSYNMWHADGVDLSQTGVFLANHDPFAGARLMEQFKNNISNYKLASALLLTMPGIPFVYYGEEVGMAHSENVENEDYAIRPPMSWSPHEYAGFSKKEPYRNMARNYMDFNVEDQQRSKDSILEQYKTLIELRRSNAALSQGTYSINISKGSKLVSYVRKTNEQEVYVIANLSEEEVDLISEYDTKEFSICDKRLKLMFSISLDFTANCNKKRNKIPLLGKNLVVFSRDL